MDTLYSDISSSCSIDRNAIEQMLENKSFMALDLSKLKDIIRFLKSDGYDVSLTGSKAILSSKIVDVFSGKINKKVRHGYAFIGNNNTANPPIPANAANAIAPSAQCQWRITMSLELEQMGFSREEAINAIDQMYQGGTSTTTKPNVDDIMLFLINEREV